LVDFPAEGGTVPALILSSKQGEIYVLTRETGESLFDVEEREVPQGGVEPEYLSPVQPFSTYHSLAMDPIEERDMWGMTPLDLRIHLLSRVVRSSPLRRRSRIPVTRPGHLDLSFAVHGPHLRARHVLHGPARPALVPHPVPRFEL